MIGTHGYAFFEEHQPNTRTQLPIKKRETEKCSHIDTVEVLFFIHPDDLALFHWDKTTNTTQPVSQLCSIILNSQLPNSEIDPEEKLTGVNRLLGRFRSHGRRLSIRTRRVLGLRLRGLLFLRFRRGSRSLHLRSRRRHSDGWPMKKRVVSKNGLRVWWRDAARESVVREDGRESHWRKIQGSAFGPEKQRGRESVKWR